MSDRRRGMCESQNTNHPTHRAACQLCAPFGSPNIVSPKSRYSATTDLFCQGKPAHAMSVRMRISRSEIRAIRAAQRHECPSLGFAKLRAWCAARQHARPSVSFANLRAPRSRQDACASPTNYPTITNLSVLYVSEGSLAETHFGETVTACLRLAPRGRASRSGCRGRCS